MQPGGLHARRDDALPLSLSMTTASSSSIKLFHCLQQATVSTHKKNWGCHGASDPKSIWKWSMIHCSLCCPDRGLVACATQLSVFCLFTAFRWVSACGGVNTWSLRAAMREPADDAAQAWQLVGGGARSRVIGVHKHHRQQSGAST